LEENGDWKKITWDWEFVLPIGGGGLTPRWRREHGRRDLRSNRHRDDCDFVRVLIRSNCEVLLRGRLNRQFFWWEQKYSEAFSGRFDFLGVNSN
jgi:hypothetical protein